MTTRRIIVLGAAAAATLALVWLIARPAPVAVDTAPVTRGPLRITVDEEGRTRVRDRFVVSAPVAGQLERPVLEAGDPVRAGEVVARIRPVALDSRAQRQASEALKAAEGAHGAALAAVGVAGTEAARAQRALARLEQVRADVPGAVAAQRLDDARALVAVADAELERTRLAADAAGHEVERTRAALMAGPFADAVDVRAPTDGHVLTVHEACERVVSAGTPILDLGDPADLEVVVDVLTDDAVRLREGSAARVSVGNGADTLAGTITRIEPAAFTRVSPLGVEEQRARVIVSLDVRTGTSVRLGDGWRVDAELVVDESPDVLLVPVGALLRVGSGWGAWIVADGRARLRTLDLAARGRRSAEVRAGLDAGDTVIVHPPDDLEEGARVRIRT